MVHSKCYIRIAIFLLHGVSWVGVLMVLLSNELSALHEEFWITVVNLNTTTCNVFPDIVFQRCTPSVTRELQFFSYACYAVEYKY